MALSSYMESGWTVQVLPWVVGACGLIQTRNMCNALEFLEVPHGKWQSIIDSTVEASIAALALMHSTRIAARTAGLSPISVSPSSKTGSLLFDVLGKRKRKAQDGQGDLGAIMLRWKKMAAASRRL